MSRQMGQIDKRATEETGWIKKSKLEPFESSEIKNASSGAEGITISKRYLTRKLVSVLLSYINKQNQ